MTGERVSHIRYGDGTVSAFCPPYIDIQFDDEPFRLRRFAYPAAFGKFLRFIDPRAAERVQADLSLAEAERQQAALERAETLVRREAELAGLRREQLQAKRSAAAKKRVSVRQTAPKQTTSAKHTRSKADQP